MKSAGPSRHERPAQQQGAKSSTPIWKAPVLSSQMCRLRPLPKRMCLKSALLSWIRIAGNCRHAARKGGPSHQLQMRRHSELRRKATADCWHRCCKCETIKISSARIWSNWRKSFLLCVSSAHKRAWHVQTSSCNTATLRRERAAQEPRSCGCTSKSNAMKSTPRPQMTLPAKQAHATVRLTPLSGICYWSDVRQRKQPVSRSGSCSEQ
mmetsp:Transcript_85541/g.169760  ORF Transcript_85541/g.169760 Transcript_85541/m.169760 type:complete len:209 (+) Transcript_85541:1065-1691(+)